MYPGGIKELCSDRKIQQAPEKYLKQINWSYHVDL